MKLGWICAVVLSAQACTPTDNDVMLSSICSLAEQGVANHGVRVRIHARYMSDRLEHALWMDPTCPDAALEAAVILEDHPEIALNKDDSSLDAFNAAVRALPEPMTAEFDMDVSGVFVWRSGENPPGGFILEKVWRFEQANAPPRPDE